MHKESSFVSSRKVLKEKRQIVYLQETHNNRISKPSTSAENKGTT